VPPFSAGGTRAARAPVRHARARSMGRAGAFPAGCGRWGLELRACRVAAEEECG